MSNPIDRDKSQAPQPAVKSGDQDAAKAAYEAKQSKEVKESVDKLRGDQERYNSMRQIREDRQQEAKSKTQGEDYDHHQGMSQ